jgi:hypothetical protein
VECCGVVRWCLYGCSLCVSAVGGSVVVLVLFPFVVY